MYPVLFKVGFITVYSYGTSVMIAVLVGWILARSRASRFGFEPASITNLIFTTFLIGLAGGRIFYVLQHFDQYQGQWLRAINFYEGGLVWYGGFLTSVVFLWIWTYFKKKSFLHLCDFLSPLLALGHAIGRIGCFLNGCCLGLHGIPTQLYESFLLAAISGILFLILSRSKRQGETFASYLFLYGLARFGIEFFRTNSVIELGLTLPQWISACLIVAGSILFFWIRRVSGKV